MPKLHVPTVRGTEVWLVVVIALMVLFLGLATNTFLTVSNLFNLLNGSAINVIFAVGLLAVLVAACAPSIARVYAFSALR